MGVKTLQSLWETKSRGRKGRMSKVQTEQNGNLLLSELAIQMEDAQFLDSCSCEIVKFGRYWIREEGAINTDRGEKFALGSVFQEGLKGTGAFQYINVIYAPSACIN